MRRASRLGIRFVARVGRAGESIARHAGRMGMLLFGIARATAGGRVPLRAFLAQAFDMGVRSLPLVLVVAVLAGVVTSQQGGYQFSGNIPAYVLGSVVTSSIVLELGPVLTAFVFISRVGARITAELGSMRVSEQIDALYTLGRDPVRVLAAPRLLAGMLVLPLLTGIADTVGIYSGMVAARTTLHLGPETFLYGVRLYWRNWDLFYSLLKGLTFGFTIPLVSAHMGLLTTGGAEGVGHSTNGAVVFMTIAVLIMDALFPPLLLG
jgi:phospholipid/cholesterol/gamma-HCH transport system permease protein